MNARDMLLDNHVSTYMSSYASPVDQELARAKDPKGHPTL